MSSFECLIIEGWINVSLFMTHRSYIILKCRPKITFFSTLIIIYFSMMFIHAAIVINTPHSRNHFKSELISSRTQSLPHLLCKFSPSMCVIILLKCAQDLWIKNWLLTWVEICFLIDEILLISLQIEFVLIARHHCNL